MNQQKTKYALQRLSDIYKQKDQALRNKYTTEGVSLTKEERAKLLRSGAVKLKKGVTSIGKYTDVVEVFDFSKHEKESTFNRKAYNKEKDKLYAQYVTIRDEIVLGDEEKALKLIKDFIK